MNKPHFIDNLNGNSLAAAIKELIGFEPGVVTNAATRIEEARIATAYFSPGGFARIAPAMALIPRIKLLLGSDPIKDSERWQQHLDETLEKFLGRKLEESFTSQEDTLREERNHIAFDRKSGRAVRQLVDALQAGNMEVRRYEKSFLHAKAYIFAPATEHDTGKLEAVIAGSSNLTASGLAHNLELNLGRYDTSTVTKAKEWFDNLWDEANLFDLAAYFEEIFEPRTPFEIFLRVLWELYGNEVDEDAKIDEGLPLTTFQKHGVVRALRLLQEAGGVIVADEVGLGKTFIAGEIMQRYKDRRQRTLLICPAALRDTSWKKFASDYQLYLDIVSFEQLAKDQKLYDGNRRPDANGNHISRGIDEYQLIIVDEAHNYRNPDAPYRADALRALLYGKRKDLLMLTATPVNNSLWDLYNLTRFFLKQDSFLADKGILSIRDRFKHAMQTNPSNLSPDVLYPIIDATTVKRTRQFIKKHYANDQIKDADGNMRTIVFPEPKAISVRYELDNLMPGLFDLIESCFNPDKDNPDRIVFARYDTKSYLKHRDNNDEYNYQVVTGLLLSGLLKRFESSTGAFRVSIDRLVEQHKMFLQALKQGHVISTEFFKDALGTDDEDFEEILEGSKHTKDADNYHIDRLRDDVVADHDKLIKIQSHIEKIKQENDPKLKALVAELEEIHKQAEEEGISRKDKGNKRKVIIFTFFADSANWIYEYIKDNIANSPKLAGYKNRIDITVGSPEHPYHTDKAKAAAKFAPDTAGGADASDETDILISTDVLAEGVNLQQARHIINYDMPWNPMRLVQRHGRIDRIGSSHNRVYLRTIFPTDRLDALIRLEELIAKKIAMAAASIGVASPIADCMGAEREFTETREEIHKLLNQDPSLFEHGGTVSSTQSGEEYRQTLRKALKTRREQIIQMSWKSGSGMRKGQEQGIFFCAKVGERVYLRFVHADQDWNAKYNEADGVKGPMVDGELGRCLRLIECEEDEPLVFDETIQDAAYDLWLVARANIHKHWMHETDPAHLHPEIRPLNKMVAEYIRDNKPTDTEQKTIEKAIDILESPWPRRDEKRLREWFGDSQKGAAKSSFIIKKVTNMGLEPFHAPKPLPPIEEKRIELLTWMGITANTDKQS